MAIAKTPSSNNKNIDLTDAIISKGGSSPSEQLYNENNNIKLTIRLSSKMLNIIDNYLENSISKKNAYLLGKRSGRRENQKRYYIRLVAF